jgi:Protein of unknown function with HXXEE motif
MSTDTMLWLVVVAFMVHEFEEVVFLQPWLAKHADDDRIVPRAFRSLRGISNSTFALLGF